MQYTKRSSLVVSLKLNGDLRHATDIYKPKIGRNINYTKPRSLYKGSPPTPRQQTSSQHYILKESEDTLSFDKYIYPPRAWW
jgi:hypothetical protein